VIGALMALGMAQQTDTVMPVGDAKLLDVETVAALDAALKDIDEALDEVARALEKDPSSVVLERMLVHHQRSRLQLLRQAAWAVQTLS